MTEQIETKTGSDWARFIRKHWAAFAVFIAAAAIAAVGAVYVFVWFVGNAQSTNLIPSTLDLWSMGNIVTFVLHAIFWELLIIGIPAAVGAVIGWQWWKRIPEEEKKQYNLSGKPSKSSRAGGAISPLLFIAFAIKVYVDGNWNNAIASWKLDYVVGSMITILIWIAAIFAVPAIIGVVWWISHETNKKP
jgi:hypothetical protein